MVYKRIENEANPNTYTDPRVYDTNDSISGAYANVLSDLSMSMSIKELEAYLSEQLHAKVTIKPNKGAK